MEETPTPERIDPAELPGSVGLPYRYPEFKVKKLAKGAPGSIRLVNRVGGALSAGSRAVRFEDGYSPEGLEPDVQDDLEKIIEEWRALNGDISCPAVVQLNLLCESRTNLTVCEVYPYASTRGLGMLVFFDVFLSGEELADFEEVNAELARLMNERKTQREESLAKAEEAARAAEEQRKADEALGKTAREHNLVAKLREAEDAIAKLRKAANKLAKKAGVKDWENAA